MCTLKVYTVHALHNLGSGFRMDYKRDRTIVEVDYLREYTVGVSAEK